MKNDRTWKFLSLAAIAGVFYVGHGLHTMAGGTSLTPAANADLIGGAMTVDAEDVLITSSADGRTLHLWTFGPWDLNQRRVPQYARSVVVGP